MAGRGSEGGREGGKEGGREKREGGREGKEVCGEKGRREAARCLWYLCGRHELSEGVQP